MNNVKSYEEYLRDHDSLTYYSTGVSMLPMLRQGKDLFTVTKKGPSRCGVGDVVLYRRPPNHFVLHRIVEVREDDYVILGDNCVNYEYGIKDHDIIGVLTGFIRRGRAHSVNEPIYNLYVFIWLHTARLRIAVKRGITEVMKWPLKR